MPRDLFDEVGSPPGRVGTRSRYTVPLSLAAHAAVILAVAAAAVFGPVVLPGLASSEMIYEVSILPPAPPPPAPPPPPNSSPPLATPNPHAAPAAAPDHIAPEPERMFDPVLSSTTGTDIIPGGSGLDTIISEPAPPPPPPPAPALHRAGGKVLVPTKVHDVPPVYPALAREARVQGLVIIEATIGVDGQVMGARILKSVPLLDEAALAAVRQWRYSPTLLNGSPVPIVMTVTVIFKLQ